MLKIFKEKTGRGFWLLQFIGWGVLMVGNFWSKIWQVEDINPWYFIFEGLLFFTLGIITSTSYKLYLKKIKFIEEQSRSNYFQALKLLLIHGIFFAGSLILLAHVLYYMVLHEPLEMGMVSFILSILNLCIFLLIWTAFYTVIKSFIRLREEKINRFRLEAALKESQLNTLKGQINPHFMFNSLNNIRGLMLEDVDKSREMLTRLSEMLRYSLNADKKNTISLGEEIDTVDNYVALSKIQMEDRLTFSKDIDRSLLDKKTPPMLLQLLVENAIKHGIANLVEGGEVKLSICKQGTDIEIEVGNSGVIVSDPNSTKVGIDNIKKRLHLLYGDDASFSLNEKDNWVVAQIILPIDQR